MRACTNAAPVTVFEHVAFLHFGWNIGITAFCSSTLVKKLKAGDHRGACDQILRWVHAGGRDCRVRGNNCGGIPIRRKLEHAVCIGRIDLVPGLPPLPLWPQP
jgi:lysozyme